MVTGAQSTPINEVEMISDSLLNSKGILHDLNTIKYSSSKSIVGLKIGDQIRLSAEEFERLSAVFFAELQAKLVKTALSRWIASLTAAFTDRIVERRHWEANRAVVTGTDGDLAATSAGARLAGRRPQGIGWRAGLLEGHREKPAFNGHRAQRRRARSRSCPGLRRTGHLAV
jgi:hypothetical protein